MPKPRSMCSWVYNAKQGQEGHAGKSPAWSVQPPEHLTFPGGGAHLGFRTLRKGYPSNREASQLHQCLQEGTHWVFHSFIQKPLPNSVIVAINLLLKIPTLPLASQRCWTNPSVFLGFSFLIYKKGWVISVLPTSKAWFLGQRRCSASKYLVRNERDCD